jgi:hypothetical protein
VPRPTDGMRQRFRSFIANAQSDDVDDATQWPYNLHRYDGRDLLLSPEDESELRAMLRSLRQDPRHGGSTSSELRARLLDLVIQVLAGQQSAGEALDELDEWLRLPVEPRRVFVPVPISTTTSVSLGRCRLHPPAEGTPAPALPLTIARTYPHAAVMEVVVPARDQRAALLSAQLPIDEALGCLTLPRTAVRQHPVGSTMACQDDKAFHSTSVAPTLMLWPSDVEDGELIAPWRRLAQALSKDISERGELERRLTAAARWYFRSIEAVHPDERVAHLFAALDTAFVDGAQGIGGKLARVIKPVIRIEGMNSPDEIGTWITDLYKERGGAIHGGSPLLLDDDVGILDSVTRTMLRGAVLALDEGAVTLADLKSRIINRRHR